MSFIIFSHLSLNTYYFIYFISIMRLTLLDFYQIKSSWSRDYLEYIKIVSDQASLGLGLMHNEVLDTSSIIKNSNNRLSTTLGYHISYFSI
ncbi:unnamed protein product [Spirodela intermedia]|uniref:Uncharacterized protein n=1 Tax=Spirodela intermedia TaxID=51605 RepID=A0A7I8L1B6_SPIIN|nr:unnamed protein product [Spirodela intermedia]